MQDLSFFASIALSIRKEGAYCVEFERVYSPIKEMRLFLRRYDQDIDGEIVGISTHETPAWINVGDRIRVIYPFEGFPVTVVPIRLLPVGVDSEYDKD